MTYTQGCAHGVIPYCEACGFFIGIQAKDKHRIAELEAALADLLDHQPAAFTNGWWRDAVTYARHVLADPLPQDPMNEK